MFLIMTVVFADTGEDESPLSVWGFTVGLQILLFPVALSLGEASDKNDAAVATTPRRQEIQPPAPAPVSQYGKELRKLKRVVKTRLQVLGRLAFGRQCVVADNELYLKDTEVEVVVIRRRPWHVVRRLDVEGINGRIPFFKAGCVRHVFLRKNRGFVELQKVCAVCSLREASCALSKDRRNAAINGILKPGLSFIGDGNGGLSAVADGETREQPRSITGTKNLMDGCEIGSS
nr:hypothetical protein Iba_chr15fCG2870 [Ipomoea batatas]